MQTTSKIKYRELRFYFCLVVLSTVIFIWLISQLFYPDTWKGYFQQANPDSLLFTRLLEQSLLKGKILTVDNYAAFPYETKTGFAPFYMWFLYSFSNIVFYFIPNMSIDPIYIASLLPIIIPWITIIFLLLSIYKLTNNKILTLFCAFGSIPNFSTMMVSGFMNLDYDYIISLFIWLWIIFGAFYIKTEKHLYVYLGAVITALFISTWTGSPFFFFFSCLYGIISWFIHPEKKSPYISYVSYSLLIGSIIALIFVPRTDESLQYFLTGNVARYSYIQGILVLLGSFFLIILNKLSSVKKTRTISLLALSIFGIIIIVFFHETLSQATGILFQKDPIHAKIAELSSGFNINIIFDGAIRNCISRFTPIIFFIPLLLLIKIDKTDCKEIQFIINWTIIIFLLAFFYQIRYIRWLGIGYGILIGFVFYYLWETIKNITFKHNFPLIRTAVIIFPILLTTITLNYSFSSSSEKLSKEAVELYSWLKAYTPPTSGYSDDLKPEYGILAYWDEGNSISFYTKRPVIVSNSMWGYNTMADVFSSEYEKDSFSLCQKYKIKYIVLNPSKKISKQILEYWPMLKSMPETPEYKLYYGELISKENFDYFYFWLTEHLGLTPLGDFNTSEHFRIVFANKNDGNTLSQYITFERVEGAKFTLNTKPNSNVSLSLEFKLDQMDFIYKINKITDETGYCQFVLPYSTGYNCGNIITDPFYKVSIENNGEKELAKLIVSDNDVVDGIDIDLVKQFEVLEK